MRSADSCQSKLKSSMAAPFVGESCLEVMA